MKSPAIIFALVAMNLLIGCTTITTENSAGSVDATGMDARLIGSWKVVEFEGKRPDSNIYIFFQHQKSDKNQAVLMDTAPKDSGWYSADIVTSKSRNYSFINAKSFIVSGTPLSDIPSGYFLWLYHFEADGSLQMNGLSDHAINTIRQDIKNHRLAGEIVETDDSKFWKSTDIHIDATSPAVGAYFAQAASKLFDGQTIKLRRIN